MSIILRKTETGYELDDNGAITKNLKVIFDARKGCGDIKLPENTLGKKFVSESRFQDGMNELDLENMPSRAGITSGVKAPATPRLKWEDFVSEEDQAVLAEIKARAEKKMARASLEAQVKKYQEDIARLMAQLEAEG